jgi:hypothetical protein
MATGLGRTFSSRGHRLTVNRWALVAQEVETRNGDREYALWLKFVLRLTMTRMRETLARCLGSKSRSQRLG